MKIKESKLLTSSVKPSIYKALSNPGSRFGSGVNDHRYSSWQACFAAAKKKDLGGRVVCGVGLCSWPSILKDG